MQATLDVRCRSGFRSLPLIQVNFIISFSIGEASKRLHFNFSKMFLTFSGFILLTSISLILINWSFSWHFRSVKGTANWRDGVKQLTKDKMVSLYGSSKKNCVSMIRELSLPPPRVASMVQPPDTQKIYKPCLLCSLQKQHVLRLKISVVRDDIISLKRALGSQIFWDHCLGDCSELGIIDSKFLQFIGDIWYYIQIKYELFRVSK